MVHVRAYGFLSNGAKKEALKTIRRSIGQPPPPEPPEDEEPEGAAERIKRLTGLDITKCPECGGKLVAAPLPLPDWVEEELQRRAKAPP